MAALFIDDVELLMYCDGSTFLIWEKEEKMKSRLVPAFVVFCVLSLLWCVVFSLLVNEGIIYLNCAPSFFLIVGLMMGITLFLHHVLCFGGFYDGCLATIDCVKNYRVFQVTSQFSVHVPGGRGMGKAQGYLLRDPQDREEKEYAFIIYTKQCVDEKLFSPGDLIHRRYNKWRKVELPS